MPATADELRQAERSFLASHPGLARRDGAKLILKDRRGNDITIANEEKCDSEEAERHCKFYDLVDYLDEMRLGLLVVSYLEGTSLALLQTSSGTITKIDGYPTFSPKRDWMIAISGEDATDFDFKGFRIFKITSARYRDYTNYWFTMVAQYSDWSAVYKVLNFDTNEQLRLAVHSTKDSRKIDERTVIVRPDRFEFR